MWDFGGLENFGTIGYHGEYSSWYLGSDYEEVHSL